MIVNRIYQRARTQSNKTAIVQTGSTMSYAVFAKRIDATRRFFERHTLPTGGTAIVLVNSLSDSWVISLSLRSLGITTICVQSMASAAALQIRDVSCIVAIERERNAHDLNERLLSGKAVIFVPTSLSQNIALSDLPRTLEGHAPFGSHIVYTSGTTGVYKKVLMPGNAEERQALRIIKCQSMHNDTVFHGANFALWTAAGIVYPPAVWRVGGTIVFDQSANWYRAFFNHEINNTFLTPNMIPPLVQCSSDAPHTGKEIAITVAGGFLSSDLYETMSESISKNVTNLYGATECMYILQTIVRENSDLYWNKVLEDRVVEIVDEQNNACAIGVEGRLRVKLLDVDADRYIDDAETSSRFFIDGYFYPGDEAVRRADGRVRVLGRTADVLNLQGQKIAVAPLEQRAQELLGVSAVCLLGGLNKNGKDELVIAIESDTVPPRKDLERLAGDFGQFEQIRFEVLKEFPRTDAGMQKIKRTALRKLFFGTHDVTN